MTNYYQILGVPLTATKEQIKLAYHTLSKKVHPDVNENNAFFNELFKEVNEAYVCLIDDTRRLRYNMQLQKTEQDSIRLREEQMNVALQQALCQISAKRKMLYRASLSLAVGVAAVAVFSFAFDAGDQPELPHESKINFLEQQKQIPVPRLANSVSMADIYRHNKVEDLLSLPAKRQVVAIPGQNLVSTTPVNSQKQIDKVDMHNFLELIRQENLTGKPARSIRLLQSGNSNITNAFDFAHFLQANGFSIAGRETISANVQGIQIQKQHNCISFTIGKM